MANFRVCELGSRDLSSNSGLSGETGGHSLESARTGPAQRIKSIANEGKTWGARMTSPPPHPGPAPGGVRAGSIGQIDAQREHFRTSEHLNLDSRMVRARKIHHD